MKKNWKWFGRAGHCLIGRYCRFHLCTQVGDFLVSTIGEYMPPDGMIEVINTVEKLNLQGKGDERERDFLTKHGYEDLSPGKKFETMVFLAGEICKEEDCGMPHVVSGVPCLESRRYNTAKEASAGHLEICETWDTRKWSTVSAGYDSVPVATGQDSGQEEVGGKTSGQT